MKLSHLYEAVDHAKLLKSVAVELGIAIDLEQAAAADIAAAIDLFHLHLDTDGSAQIRARLQEIEKLAMDSKPLPDGMEGLEYLEETSFGELVAVKTFYEACKQIKATAQAARRAAETSMRIYFLLSAINEAATTTMSSKHTADEVKYRASIARAAMKQLGMTPKDL
jgi:hypothetical protein